MDAQRDAHSKDDDLRVENQGLLFAGGRHFLVRIVEVTPATIRTTFPGRDYPVPGMVVDLEFHDEGGFTSYQTRVVQGPAELGEGLLLERPKTVRRDVHRHCVRVPAGFAVQVKDQIHIKKYPAELINLSAGGALIRTDAPLDVGTAVELVLAIPDGPTQTVLGRVVHAAVSEVGLGKAGRLLGIQFVGIEPEVGRVLIEFIWQRLREGRWECTA